MKIHGASSYPMRRPIRLRAGLPRIRCAQLMQAIQPDSAMHPSPFSSLLHKNPKCDHSMQRAPSVRSQSQRATYEESILGFCLIRAETEMLARFTQWVAKFSGKELVGKDPLGNSYFRKPHTNDSGVVTEKRFVEFVGDPEPSSVPVEWSRWLTYTRKDAPTPQETLEKEMYRKNVKIKVALLQKEEEKRLYRAKTIQKEGVDMSPQSMERFLRQVSNQDARGQSGDQADSSSSTEPSGSGDNFVPGKWRP